MYTEKISKYIDDNKNAILADIAQLVAIPSVKGEPECGLPFGKYPAEALGKVLEMCEKSGFSVKNISNAIGYADMNDMPLELGILAHVDVVPAGDGWDTDPFEMVQKNGNIYGRGVSDDKGPAIAALYAMKAVKALGIPLKKNVRLILGSDEECGSSDLEYYFNNEETPNYSFSPDAEFPLINTEKGRFAPLFSANVENEENLFPRIVSFDSGDAVNAVPHIAQMNIVGAEKTDIENACGIASDITGVTFDIDGENGCFKVTATGKAAHASLPDTGNNALTALLLAVRQMKLSDCKSSRLLYGLGKLFPYNDWHGKALGIECEDQISGKLTITLDVLHFDGKKISCFFDSRTPICSNDENTVIPVKNALNDIGFDIESFNVTKPHHVDPESKFIKTLLSVYERHTGKKGECMAIGGGTYVHNIKNGVAFGSIMPDVDTHMHGANEFMPFDDIVTAAKIYADAIVEICG